MPLSEANEAENLLSLHRIFLYYMKTLKSILLSTALCCACVSANAQQLAFPGAQGWGRFATGGRGGTVYHVTNLNDSGAGSLRDAVSQPNRIVVFDVAGVINLSSRLVFSANLTVAGQTAPGEGITVYGNGVSFSGASNIIVRHMRFRMGIKGDSGKDAAGIANGAGMIFDHCSFAWGRDETFSINPDGKGTAPENITLQYCVIGQGLLDHSAGGLMQSNYISLIGNLYCDNSTRNNKIKGINQYANNIVYNWKDGAYIMGGDSQGSSYVNIQSNLFINGPSGGGNAFTTGNADFHAYVEDNWQDSNRDGIYDPTAVTNYSGATLEAEPYDYPELDLMPASQLIAGNLPTVGASLPYRDYTDCYMVDEVLSFGTRGALIANENNLIYGAPSTWTVWPGEARTDTDGDGMPDDWELANGTDPNANDAMAIAANGYANIENYINSITRETRQYFLRQPLFLSLAEATATSLTLTWCDYTDNEEGFIIEMEKDGEYVEVARTAADVNTVVLAEGLAPATGYSVRACAFDGDRRSAYTPAIVVKTRPEQTDLVDCDAFTGTGDGEWLIAPETDETITLDGQMEKTAVVVRGSAHVTLEGPGGIAGSASLNKTGEGTLTVTTTNTYRGATVLHGGVLEFSSLKRGGEASAIGASDEFAQNWIMDGGTYRYTGDNTTTNRSATLYRDTELNIDHGTVTFENGTAPTQIEGEGNLIIGGGGQITLNTTSLFAFEGDLVLRGSTLYYPSTNMTNGGIGTASRLVLEGGKYQTKGDNAGYEEYTFPIYVPAGNEADGTIPVFAPHRNCYIKSTVTGGGTFQLDIPYLREYLSGNYEGFTGRLIANGINSNNSEGSLLLLEKNSNDLPNAAVTLKGNARLGIWATEGNARVGGLSGDKGTYLLGSSKNTKNFTCTWTVGNANTDETFHGIINNWSLSGSGYTGTVNIVKEGSGLWRLTGTNDYKGTTQVNGGLLIVNGRHSGTGAVTVATGATLGGTGTIAGKTTLNGTLLVGDTLATDHGLTFAAGLTLGSGVVLQLNDAMAEAIHYNGDRIQVFAGSVTGEFADIVPAIPGEGQTWDTSELYTAGVLIVVGGEERPDEPEDPEVDPGEAGPTVRATLAWGNCAKNPSDGACTELVGTEASPSNNVGLSMCYTNAPDKTYSSAGTPKFSYDFDGIDRTGIKVSNGAQNAIYMPDGARATKLVLYSVVASNSSNRTSYWKEVAGVTYTEETATILDLTKTASNPNRVEFDLDNVPSPLTFTNAGEQQAVVIVLEYHIGGPTGPAGIETVVGDGTAGGVWTDLEGRPVQNPQPGHLYICGGRKVIFR